MFPFADLNGILRFVEGNIDLMIMIRFKVYFHYTIVMIFQFIEGFVVIQVY